MLKGTATIELTDVKTGKKEVVKHDNLVTNAINDLLTLNPLGFRFRTYYNTADNTNDSSAADQRSELGYGFGNSFMPVCPKAAGGILLYENALDENPQKYYAPISNTLVGYSSNDVNETTDDRRGSMNQVESGPLEDGSGYRFVFDFATTQANGTIAAVGLTSERGGKAGYGAATDKVGYPMLMVSGTATKMKDGEVYKEDDYYTHNSFVSMDAENDLLYFSRVLSPKTIAVGKVKAPLSSARVAKDFFATELVDMEIIETTKFAEITNTDISVTISGSRFYFYRSFFGTFVDGNDGYIWGFQHKGNTFGNSTGKASVLWIRINKADYSFEEGEWNIDGQLFAFGYSTYNDAGLYNLSKRLNNLCIIHDGRLYVLKHDRKGVYSINLSNITDVTLLECDFEIQWYLNSPTDSAIRSYTTTPFYTSVIALGDIITYRNAFICNGEIKKVGYGKYNYSGYFPASYNEIFASTSNDYAYSKNYGMVCNSITHPHCGPFFVNVSPSMYYYNAPNAYSQCHLSVYLMTPYLATINNLPTPVQKTADKTMKITYILREES